MTSLPKIDLKLNEENEISFRLSIEGNESLDSKPVFRFVMTELDSGRGWVFPGKADGNDLISVKIPSLKEGFSAKKRYHGRLEVIVGSHYFNPTEMMVEFNQPMTVSAVPVITSKKKAIVTESSKEEENEEKLDEEFDLETIVSEPIAKDSTSNPKSVKPLDDGEIAAFSKVAFTDTLVHPPVVQTGTPDLNPEDLLPKGPKPGGPPAPMSEHEKERTKFKQVLKAKLRGALLNESPVRKK